jgi:DNA-binding XRE family transcriptional regulator
VWASATSAELLFFDPDNGLEVPSVSAGMHLVSIEGLAEYVGVSRPTMQAIVAYDITQRSRPKTETAIKIADAFGITLNALYQEPSECLQEAIAHFQEASSARTVEPPPVKLRDVERRMGVTTVFEKAAKKRR